MSSIETSIHGDTMKRIVLALSMIAMFTATASADDKAKKDDTAKKKDDTVKKDDKAKPADEPTKCLIIKAGEKEVSPPAEVDYMTAYKSKAPITPVAAKALCKSQSTKVAQAWIKDNKVCETKKLAWKYTLTFGTAVKPTKWDLNVTCPKK